VCVCVCIFTSLCGLDDLSVCVCVWWCGDDIYLRRFLEYDISYSGTSRSFL